MVAIKHTCLRWFYESCFDISELVKHVWTAEQDKQSIEEKFTTNAAALDSLNDQMNNLSIKLESAEEMIRERKFHSFKYSISGSLIIYPPPPKKKKRKGRRR